jgi:hypothetical protein
VAFVLTPHPGRVVCCAGTSSQEGGRPGPDTGPGPVLGRGLYIQVWLTVTRLISVTTVTRHISYRDSESAISGTVTVTAVTVRDRRDESSLNCLIVLSTLLCQSGGFTSLPKSSRRA